MTPNAIDLCAGAGGLSLGLARAGFDVLGVERDGDAWRTHRENVGPCRLADLTEFHHYDKAVLVGGGVPCFAAGTMILSYTGYRPIEEIEVGDLVLTHLGRWRRVTCVMRRYDAPLRFVQGQGMPGMFTTDEHPFLARKCTYAWDNSRRRYGRKFADPEWVAAESLAGGYFVGQVLPRAKPDDRAEAFWWLVGRYLADGWILDGKRTSKIRQGKRGSRVNSNMHRVTICCAKREQDELAERIISAGFKATPQIQRTVVKFNINSSSFVEFLRQFGRYSHGKTIPRIALELDHRKSKALLEGYSTGDGSRKDGTTRITTVSKSLALGVALLAQRAYGTVASVKKCKLPKTCVIEGRVCNQRDFYVVTIQDRNRSAFVEGRYGWKLIRKSYSAGSGTVYNISVKEDESYVAEGAIVHNCQAFSNAGKGEGMSRKDGRLFRELIRIGQEASADVLLIENVRGLLARKHGERPVIEIIESEIRAAGYWPTWTVLDAADYGVPQHRDRLFVVAFRHLEALIDFRWPDATHGPGLLPWATVRQALGLGDGAFIAGKPEGTGYQGMRSLDVDAPATTVGGGAEPFANRRYREAMSAELAKAGVLDRPGTTVSSRAVLDAAGNHKSQHDGAVQMLLEQLAILQDFPPGFRFHGNVTSRHRQCGNAVPVRLGEAVGRQILAALRSSKVLR